MLRRAIALLFIYKKCYNRYRIGDIMKNNKGFISMSLVYSFLIVFVAISISLLAVYTENINKIRKLNNEIKADLMAKGNERIIVLNNKIRNGSFETLNGVGFTGYWTIGGTGCSLSNKTPKTNPAGGAPIIGQAFYDQQSIEALSADCTVTSNETITMTYGHVYYIERIYNAGNGYAANSAGVKFYQKVGDVVSTTAESPTLTNFSKAKVLGSGWTMPTATSMGTVDADLFRFWGTSGEYLVQMYFTDSGNNQPFYVDGLMLIDLTESVGSTRAVNYMSKKDEIAGKIWRLKATKMGTSAADAKYTTQGYYEGRKAFSALGPYNIK